MNVARMGIVAGQASAEPAAVLRRLISKSLDEGATLRLFRGMSLIEADAIPDTQRLKVLSTGLLGSNGAVWSRGQLELLPERVSVIPSLLRSGVIRNDVTVVRAARTRNGFSVGIVCDYLPAALATAGAIVVQQDDEIPIMDGAPEIPFDRVLEVVNDPTSQIPVLNDGESTPEDLAIGEHVAGIVEDGDCIQIGIGGLGRAIAGALAKGRRRLGIHTGLINDTVLDLIDSGTVTNEAKTDHRGYSVTPLFMGSSRFYRRLVGRKDLVLRPVDYTNDPRVLAGIPRLTAINSAVQVDLLGQVNSEFASGRRISAVGGQLDFAIGAGMSDGGKSIVVLKSTAAQGTVSRIVPRVEVSSVGATFTDFVVTEFGVADLRGKTLEQRARSIAGICHPDFRKGLREQAELGLASAQPVRARVSETKESALNE